MPRISQLPDANLPLSGSELVPVVQGGATKHAPASALPTTLLRSFGYIGDGLSHPVSSRFGTLGLAQAVYPSCLSLADEIDGLALQTALDSFGSNPAALDFPPASIGRCSRAISTGRGAVSLMGNWSTLVFVTAGSGAFVHSSAAVYQAGLHIEKLALQCVGAGGTAIGAAFNPLSGDFVLTDVLISGYGNQGTNYWTALVYATNASLSFFTRVTGVGINSALLSSVGNGITFASADAGIYQFTLRDCTVNYYQTALVLLSQSSPGLEGVVCDNFQANGCMRGVFHSNDAADGNYTAPQFVFQNCQWNLYQQWMSFHRASEIWITDNLMYVAPPSSATSGTTFSNANLLDFTACFDVTISGNSVEGDVHSRFADLINVGTGSNIVAVKGHNTFHQYGAMTGVGMRLAPGVTNVKEDGTSYYQIPGALFNNAAGVIATGNVLVTAAATLGGQIDVAGSISYMATATGTTDTSGVMAVTLPTGMFTGVSAAIVCNGDATAVNSYHPAVLTCTTSTLTVQFLGLTSAFPARVNYIIRGY